MANVTLNIETRIDQYNTSAKSWQEVTASATPDTLLSSLSDMWEIVSVNNYIENGTHYRAVNFLSYDKSG